jgi:hypothetical protein
VRGFAVANHCSLFTVHCSLFTVHRSTPRPFGIWIEAARPSRYPFSVERIVKKSRSFRAADRWDIRQNVALTPEQRMQIAHALRKRAYPGKHKDVRACHRAS